MRNAQLLKVISIGAGVVVGGFLVVQLVANIFFSDNAAEVAQTTGSAGTSSSAGKQQIVYVNDPYVEPLGEQNEEAAEGEVVPMPDVMMSVEDWYYQMYGVPYPYSNANVENGSAQQGTESEEAVPTWTEEIYAKFEVERAAFITEVLNWSNALDIVEEDVLSHYNDDVTDFALYLSTYQLQLSNTIDWADSAVKLWLEGYEGLKENDEYEEVHDEMVELREMLEELIERAQVFNETMLVKRAELIEKAHEEEPEVPEFEDTYSEKSECPEGGEELCGNVPYALFKIDEAWRKDVLDGSWISDNVAEEKSVGVVVLQTEEGEPFNFFFWVEQINEDGSLWVSAYNTGWNPYGYYVWLIPAENVGNFEYMHFNDEYIAAHGSEDDGTDEPEDDCDADFCDED